MMIVTAECCCAKGEHVPGFDVRDESLPEVTGISQNMVSGTVHGPAVQAGSIHGGVHIHYVQKLDIAPAVVPRQLPPVQEHFINRQRELSELSKAAQRKPGKRTVLVITGTGGVGKTALAVSWSSRRVGDFPDGMLYADMGAFDPTAPASPNEVLGQFLRSLGASPEAIPVRLEDRSAMFRSLSQDKSLLVLVDNVASARQVKPLLPTSERCVVLVTARSQVDALIADGAKFLNLHPLGSDAALELLFTVLTPGRISAEAEAAAQLIRFCGGLPIALWVTIARLAAHPRLSIGKVARELSDENNRISALSSREELSVEMVFDLSYQALPGDGARLYRLLGLHPGPDFSTDAAAAVASMTRVDVERILTLLVEANLLEEIGDDRFLFHDLLRLHARQHAEQEETVVDRAIAVNRLLDYYIFVANRADQLINLLGGRARNVELTPQNVPGFATHADAINWMDTERRNLLAGIRFAANNGWPHQAAELAGASIYFLRLKGYWSEALELCQYIATICEAIGNLEGLADMQFYCGDIYRLTGALSEAQEWYERALVSYRNLADGYREARTQHSIGDIKRTTREDAEALGRYEAALAIYRNLAHPLAEARALHSIADTYRISGQNGDALVRYRQILSTYRDLNDAIGQARVIHSIGDIVRLSGDLDEARISCQRALESYREHGDRLGEAEALGSLGEIYLDMEQNAAAIRHYEDALVIYRSLGNRRCEADTLQRLEEIMGSSAE